MADAVRLMPAGHLNRPFAQYHAARAAALRADTTAAVAFLQQTWGEEIESLTISFAEYDSAFAAIVGGPVRRLLGPRPGYGGRIDAEPTGTTAGEHALGVGLVE
jgi:hypothetical protein